MPSTFSEAALALAAAFLLGFSKTGIVGLGILIVPMIATVFPDQALGVLAPMLIFGDLFAVARYRRHAEWRVLGRLLPWVAPGLGAGYFALRAIPKEHFVRALGVLVLAMVAMTVLWERAGARLLERLPRARWFTALMGSLAGVATMVGHVAGPIMSVYLIRMGMDKRRFMGTGAWYYLIVNCAKVPFYAGLAMITPATLRFNAATLPVIAIGAGVGILVFARIPQRWFNRVILALAFVAALRLVVAGGAAPSSDQPPRPGPEKRAGKGDQEDRTRREQPAIEPVAEEPTAPRNGD